MGKKQKSLRTMITNFDSTEQREEWNAIVRGFSTYPSERLWCRTPTYRPCERLLNDCTAIATHFAGIVRTAYMYCPKILLNEAQLLDGIFFLALGPTAVNGVLGKSYKDGPAIIVSGMGPTLEGRLISFTTSTIDEVRQKAKANDSSLSDDDLPCAGTGQQLTLRPLEYAALGATVTVKQSLGFDAHFYSDFTRQMEEAEANGTSKAGIIAEAFARALYGDESGSSMSSQADCWHDAAIGDRCRFLGQRWQEWIDAEKQGLVLYENQKDPANEILRKSEGFNHYFAANAKENESTLANYLHLHRSDSADGVEFARALHDISSMPQRTNARIRISQTALPDGNEQPIGIPDDDDAKERASCSDDGMELTRRLLRDWYQFVYQKTMAQHLGADLVAVSVPNNSFARLAGRRDRHSSLVLAGSITRQLGGMPYVMFAAFCYQSLPVIEAWRECDSNTKPRIQKKRTRDVAYAVDVACQRKSLKNDAKDILWGGLIAAVLAFVSAMTDNVWLNGNAPIWMVVLAAWFIGVVPNLIDIAKWMRGAQSSFKTVVYLHS